MLSPKEKAALRESFHKMTPAQKADYIFTYYKWPILLAIVALFVVGDFFWRGITKKDVVVYLGMANVAVGEDLEQALTEDFLRDIQMNPRKNAVQMYKGLYLSNDATVENHEYAYASKLKLMASVESKKMDVVLMNREAYDLLSAGGYLLELPELLGEDFPGLVENELVLEDNSIEYQLNEVEELRIVTEKVTNGVEVGDTAFFRDAGFDGAVYAGVICNSPRLDRAVEYITYLCAE